MFSPAFAPLRRSGGQLRRKGRPVLIGRDSVTGRRPTTVDGFAVNRPREHGFEVCWTDLMMRFARRIASDYACAKRVDSTSSVDAVRRPDPCQMSARSSDRVHRIEIDDGSLSGAVGPWVSTSRAELVIDRAASCGPGDEADGQCDLILGVGFDPAASKPARDPRLLGVGSDARQARPARTSLDADQERSVCQSSRLKASEWTEILEPGCRSRTGRTCCAPVRLCNV